MSRTLTLRLWDVRRRSLLVNVRKKWHLHKWIAMVPPLGQKEVKLKPWGGEVLTMNLARKKKEAPRLNPRKMKHRLRLAPTYRLRKLNCSLHLSR